MVPHIKKWHDYYLLKETADSNQILYLVILGHTWSYHANEEDYYCDSGRSVG